MTPIFITGATGYIGKRLMKQLVLQGYDITALVRKGSENRLPKGVRAIIADPFDASSFQQWIPKGATFIHLLGVSHASPRKKQTFTDIDLRSVKTAADAAMAANVSHFIYLSTAMAEHGVRKNHRAIRKQGEAYVLSKHLPCTFIRPWYVVGPGRYWPLCFLPVYGLAKTVPQWKQKAKGKEFIGINPLLRTITKAIETPPQKQRVFEVSHMKKNSLPAI